eukprot:4416324-Pyramimonas_sp.AAC.1
MEEALPVPISHLRPHVDQNPPGLLLLERGLLPLPQVPQYLLQMPTDAELKRGGDPQALTGDLYLGGSFMTDYPDRGFSAWDVVALAGHINMCMCTLTGLLPYPLQDIDGAELFAFYASLLFAVPPAVFHTDSDFVWRGVNVRGPVATAHASSAWA